MRGFSGLLMFILIMIVLQAAWPLIVVAIIYMVIRFIIFSVARNQHSNPYQHMDQYQDSDDQQQVNEDWINRSNQQADSNKDVIDAEYTERDADK
ncbi:hypothetical protein SDC9_95375 [bioreactor metagenome]|uniref:Uncharacterized protein n=1 Tax=bioreactor metagenome TaxID=1076179 RepID=A0A645A661_9ZZZZ|nr:hypothetical protein [Erysipelotrichaceae bacterium]